MSTIYTAFKNELLTKLIDVVVDDINISLVTSDYTPNASDTLATISAYFIGTPLTLDNKSVVNGSFIADPVTFIAVAQEVPPVTIQGVLIYSDTTPIVLINSGAGVPITPNGGDIGITFTNGNTVLTL